MPLILNPQARERFAAHGARQFFDLGGGDAPAPDPLIGQSALKTAQLGEEGLQFAKDAYYNDIRPQQQQLTDLTKQVTTQQLADQRASSQFAEEQRNQYRGLYMPLESRVVADANNYDSAGNVNQRMGIASANVTQAFSNAREQSIRALQKYGLNPNSGAFAATNQRLAAQEALADAGARTGAAFDTMDKGIALRAGAAQTGRGLSNSAAQTLATGTQAGSSAVGAGNSTQQSNIAGTGVVGAGFGQAMQGNVNAGNLMNSQYQGQLNAYGQQQEKQGAVFGSLAGLAGAAIIASSKKVKDRREPLDPKAVLEKVKGLKVDQWSYKGDPQRHIGPYAEDLNQKFGVGDGSTIGATDNGGIALVAVKGLAEDVDQIKQALGIKPGSNSQPQQRGVRMQ